MTENEAPVSRRQRRELERQRRKLSRGSALTLGAAAALAAVPAAQAATFTVTNTNDAGAGSLRQAVLDANGAAGADIIAFGAGATGTITLTTGQIAITDTVDIQGPGSTVLAVDGNNTGRVFYLYSSAGLIDVTISGLTIQNGGAVTFGAGIIDFGENLTLDGVVISGCDATAGGGAIAATDFSGDSMELTVRNSSITGNTSGRDGGGIYFYTTGGPMLIEGSIIQQNTAVDDGGGIYLYDITSDLTIQDALGQPTGILSNTAGGFGGGIYFYQTDGGTQTIAHSIIDGNSAYLGGGMLSIFSDTPVTIDHSTISGNTAVAGGGLFSVFSFAAPVTVVDSTVSGNTATSGDGGGLFFYALYAGGTAAVNNTTVAANTGTGLFTLADPITVRNSIAGDNAPADLATGPAGNFAVAFSLIENQGTATVTSGGGNVIGTDGQLGPLANNGGPTLTHKPAATSPAINAGDPAFVPPPATDQRDLARVVGGRIDMGAVELGLPGTIQLTLATQSVGEAAGTVTVTATRTGGSEGAVSVTIDAADGSAVDPADYGPVVASSLNWADGDTADKTLVITIVNDVMDEVDETFTVTISAPTGGATLGAITTQQITILDDDLPLLEPQTIPTVGEWGMLLLSALFAAAGVYKLRKSKGLAPTVLTIALVAGGATVVSAAVRDTRATTVATVRTAAQQTTIQLADGSSISVDTSKLIIKDRRGKKLNPELSPSQLVAGQPVVVKVRRGTDGAIKQVRVAVFDSLQEAQAAEQRHGNN